MRRRLIVLTSLVVILSLCLSGWVVLSRMAYQGEEAEGGGGHVEARKPALLRLLERACIAEGLEEVAKREWEESLMGQLAVRIDTYLARRGSPLAGYGRVFVVEGQATGINPILSVAIAGKESSFGLACFAPHNAWGMLAYPRGFSSWSEGIKANFAWLKRHYGSPQSAYDCPGYCIPDQPWMREVQAIMEEV